MKKIFLLSLFALATVVSVNAQSFGIKGGLNLANFGGDVEDNSMKVGFHLGGFAEFAMNDQIKIQPELVYSAQGTQSSEESDYKLKVNYLNIPVMAKFYVSDAFNIQAGPQVGFLLSAEATDGSVDVDMKDAYKGTDFGLGLGLGYKHSNIDFSFRYNIGLANIIEGVEGSDDKVSNQVIQLSVGYAFN